MLSDNVQSFNVYRDFEDDEPGLLPYGFDKMALTNGAKAVVKKEGDNKYLSLTTASTAGKANLILPFNGSVTNTSGNKVVVEYKARFTGNYTYANAAMLKNDADLYSMVAAFDNNGGARAIKVQNAGTKTTVMNFESGRWYSFKMVGDFTTHKYSVYVDNNLVASDFTFRDSTGTRLTGQLIGIDGFANGQLDFDDFSVRVVSDQMLSNAASNVISKVNDVRGKLNSYSYPIGDRVGCYKTSAYNNLNSVLNSAEQSAQSQLSDDSANVIIKSIEDAWDAFDASLKLTSGNANYYAYRDFENDTAGNLLPYGFTVYNIDNGGEAAIVSENGNKFLRLTTGAQAGHVNMALPYVNSKNTGNEDVIISEFSARFNADLRYANACIAKNQNDGAATSIAFDNASSARKVILKKSASSSVTAGYFEYGTWHNYKAVIDMRSKTYSLYMDGVLKVSDYDFRDKETILLTSQSFGIDGFANGQLDFDNFKVYTESEGVAVSDEVIINGYQISATAKGMRTVYSVANSIDGKSVVSSGLLYSLSDYADFNELTVGSDNTEVYSYASTAAGKLENAVGLDKSYAMTMTFASNNPKEYTTGWIIRAWAQLSDGTYAYSDAYEYTIYNVAERLYTGNLMPSQFKHDYLYNNILTLVNPAYAELTFKWGNSVANW